MRVCLLSPELLPAWGGIGAYTYHLAKGLSRYAEVHVLTANRPDPEESRTLDGVRVHAVLGDRSSDAHVSPLRFQLAVSVHLPRLIRQFGFDIVHANHAYMSDLFVRPRRDRAVQVLTVHTTLDTQRSGTKGAGTQSPRQGIEKTVLRWRTPLELVEGRYLRRNSHFIFVSNWVRWNAVEHYRIRPLLSAVVPNGVDPSLFTPETQGSSERRNEGPTILFAGRLLALKGIETLLRAVSELGGDIRLLLAGPGDRTKWRALARSLGLGPDRCAFLGPVPYAEMPALYRRANAVVLPSHVESCPMVALEAMASGVPLIASAAGGIPEIVRDGVTGWLFLPGDVGRLRERLELVLGDGSQVRDVCRAAREWVVSQATVDRMVVETLRFYERLLNGGGAS